LEIVVTNHLTEYYSQQINNLWNDEYPLSLRDRFHLLFDDATNSKHYLICDSEETVLAWGAYFEKDSEIRFSIIVRENQQGNGLGSMIIERIKDDLDEFYGWVIDHDTDKKANSEFYQSPLEFYIRHGFEVLTDVRIDTDMIRAVKIHYKKP